MQTHPDKGGDTEQFKKLNEAYETLSDQSKRSMYDRFGKGGPSRATPSSSEFPSDLFGSFGGFSIPLMYTIEISLEDLFKGRALNVEVNGQDLTINIEAGMYDGIKLQGQVMDQRGVTRDIIFVIQEKEHPTYKRLNADLYMELSLSLKDALLGFERPLQHLDGSTFVIKSPENEISSPNEVLVLDNLGMPMYSPRSQSSGRGKLYVKLIVEFPFKMWLNETERTKLENLLPGSSAEPNTSFSNIFGKDGRMKSKTSMKTTPLIPRKGNLNSFGQSGKPQRAGSAFGGDGSPFGSFFFG